MYDSVYKRAFSYVEALMEQLHFDFNVASSQKAYFYQNASPEVREHDFHIFLKECKKVIQLEKKQGDEGTQVILLFAYIMLIMENTTLLSQYYPFANGEDYDKEAVRREYLKSGLLANEAREKFIYERFSANYVEGNRGIVHELLFDMLMASKIPEFLSVQSSRQFTIFINFPVYFRMVSGELSFPSFERFPFVRFLRNPPVAPHPCSQAQWDEVKAEVMEGFYQAYTSLSDYDKFMATGMCNVGVEILMPLFLRPFLIQLVSTSYGEKIREHLEVLENKILQHKMILKLETMKKKAFSAPYTKKDLDKNWILVEMFQKLKHGLPLTAKETERMNYYFASTCGSNTRDYYLFSRMEFMFEINIRLQLDQLKERNQEIEKANLALEQEKARTGRILAEMSHEKTHITNSVNVGRLEQVWEDVPNLQQKELIFDLNTEKRDYLLRDFSLIDKQYSKEPSDWVEIFQEHLDLDPGNGNFLTMLDEALYHLLHHFQQDRSWMKNPQLQEVLMPLNSCDFLNPLLEKRYDYLIDWFGDAYYPVKVTIEGSWSDAFFPVYSYENDLGNISLAYIQWVEIFTIVWEYLFAKGAKNSGNQLDIHFFQEEHRYGISFGQKKIENQHDLPWQELGLCYLGDFLEELNEGEGLKEEGDTLTLYLPLTILQEKQGDRKT